MVETLPDNDTVCKFVITDEHWLHDNVLALLSNAVKYSVGGVVTISVTLVNADHVMEVG